MQKHVSTQIKTTDKVEIYLSIGYYTKNFTEKF